MVRHAVLTGVAVPAADAEVAVPAADGEVNDNKDRDYYYDASKDSHGYLYCTRGAAISRHICPFLCNSSISSNGICTNCHHTLPYLIDPC